MKIYNRRGFLTGLLFCGGGVFDLVMLAVGFFQAFRWFWYIDAAVFLLIGGILLFRAVSREKAQRDLTENWKIGQDIIYNRYGFLDGIWFLLCAVGSLVTGLSRGLRWHIYTFLFLYFGLDRIDRAVTLEDARKDITEERDERNRMVVLKTQAASFRITQTVSLLLMAFFVLKGGRFNQVDLASAGVGAALCFLVTILAGLFARKYYEKHL